MGWTVTNQRAPRISARRSRAALAPSEVSHARSRHRNGHSHKGRDPGWPSRSTSETQAPGPSRGIGVALAHTFRIWPIGKFD